MPVFVDDTVLVDAEKLEVGIFGNNQGGSQPEQFDLFCLVHCFNTLVKFIRIHQAQRIIQRLDVFLGDFMDDIAEGISLLDIFLTQ